MFKEKSVARPLGLATALVKRKAARMAESVDALVSNTSGATRAGSTPPRGTYKKRRNKVLLFFLVIYLYYHHSVGNIKWRVVVA